MGRNIVIEYVKYFYFYSWDYRLILLIFLLGFYLSFQSAQRTNSIYPIDGYGKKMFIFIGVLSGFLWGGACFLVNSNISFYISSCICFPYMMIRWTYYKFNLQG